MTTIAVQPFVLKNALLKIGADNYEKHVSQVELRPTVKADKVTWVNITPDVPYSEAANPETTWDLVITYAQDWETADSLSQYLMDNAGTVKSVELAPRAGTGRKTFTINATIVAGPIGGSAGAVAVGSVTLPCDGQPVEGTLA